MKYRAILNDPGDTTQERAQQILSNSLSDIREWAQKKLESAVAPNAKVNIYVQVETMREIITKKGKE